MTTPPRLYSPPSLPGPTAASRTPGHRRVLLCSAALLPFAAAVCVQAAGTSPAPLVSFRERPRLVFEQYQVDLGPVPAVREVGARYTFRNVGTKTLRIRELKPSCGCLQPQLDRRTFAPGETGSFFLRTLTAQQKPGLQEFTVTVIADEVDAAEGSAAAPPEKPGAIVPVVAEKPVTSAADPQPQPAAEVELTFRAIFSPKQVFVRPRALIVYQLSDQPTTQELTLFDQRDKSFEITGAACSSPLVAVRIGKSDVDEDGTHRHRVSVTVAARVPPGKTRAVVTIATSDPAYKAVQVPMIIQGPEGSDLGAAADPPERPVRSSGRRRGGDASSQAAGSNARLTR